LQTKPKFVKYDDNFLVFPYPPKSLNP